MAIPKASSRKFVPLELVEVYEDNPREHATDAEREASYISLTMQEQLAQFGQQTPARLEKIGERYIALQGNRRLTNLKILQSKGIIDPRTVKYENDGAGQRVPVANTGKPFSVIEADIYEGPLTQAERLELVLDQGATRTFNKVEVFLSAELAFKSGYTERETLTILGDLFKFHYPPTRKIKEDDGGVDLLNYYKGVLQTLKWVWRSPLVVREAFIKRLKGEQRWPQNAMIEKMYKIFSEEQDKDKLAKINRNSPGPKFLAAWAAYVAEQQRAAAEGTKPRPMAMMNRQQLEDSMKQLTSRIFKLADKCILRHVAPEVIARLDEFLVGIEATLTDEQNKALDDMFLSDNEPEALPQVAASAPAA